MQIHQSAEDYLEKILMLNERLGYARSVDIANELGVTKPSVSIAMKRLRESGFVEVDSSGHISLLPEGKSIAERIYRRHKVLSCFLVSLGISEGTAAEDACRVEHVLSEESFSAICRFVESLKDKTVQDESR